MMSSWEWKGWGLINSDDTFLIAVEDPQDKEEENARQSILCPYFFQNR